MTPDLPEFTELDAEAVRAVLPPRRPHQVIGFVAPSSLRSTSSASARSGFPRWPAALLQRALIGGRSMLERPSPRRAPSVPGPGVASGGAMQEWYAFRPTADDQAV